MERAPQRPPNSGFLLLAWGPNPCLGRISTRVVFSKSVLKNKEDRAKLLGSLASALRAIPARDTLLLAGDFNVQLHASQNLVGRSSTPRENTGVKDESFQRFVESHRLVALNTWSSGRGHTDVQGDASPPQLGFGRMEEGRAFPNLCRGSASGDDLLQA